MKWQVAEAKNKLSEVLSLAETEGPQEIRRRGKIFILIEQDQYLREKKPRPSFKYWLLNGPVSDDLDVSRDQSPMLDGDLRDPAGYQCF